MEAMMQMDFWVASKAGATINCLAGSSSAFKATMPGPMPTAAGPVVLFPGDRNHSSIELLASGTGRVGYAWDRFLGYVRAGVAWERDEYHVSSPRAFVVATASETRGGWTVGVGGEYAFTNFLSAFVEYNYYDFGNRDLTFVSPRDAFVVGIDETKTVLKGGFNYRFGAWGAPVAGRY